LRRRIYLTPAATGRDPGIDVLRAVAVLLVVFGHGIQYSNKAFDENLVFKFIYSFHIPLFFFLSGFLAFRSSPEGYLPRKSRQLLIPYFAWMAIYYLLFNGADPTLFGPGRIAEYLVDSLVYQGDGSLWFLWVLFTISVVHALSRSLRYKYVLYSAAILCLYPLQEALPSLSLMGLGLVRWHLFFFMAGLFFAEYDIAGKMRWSWVLPFVPLGAYSFLAWNRCGNATVVGFDIDSQLLLNAYTLAIRYASAGSMIVVLFHAKKYCSFDNKVVRWISLKSLAFYSTQYVFIHALRKTFTNAETGVHMLKEAAFALTILGCSAATILLASQVGWIDKVFFGNVRPRELPSKAAV
jgi:fucose 4-O-acetylase-like acetyltransferase